MKPYISNALSAVIILSIVLSSEQPIMADDDNGDAAVNDNIATQSIHNPFDGWTDEQFKSYEDSIYNALYPPVYLCTTDSTSEILNDSDTYANDAELSLNAEPLSYVPNTITIGNDKAVGQIDIKSGMNQFGAKTYDVPIDVYPGMNGMTPQISLSYNSFSRNSFTGMGWSISGIPSITREPNSIYYSDKTSPITLKYTDIFSLDGIKLLNTGKILSNEPSLDNYIIYESEYGNIKAKVYVMGDIVEYFEVFYPNGRKATFGYKDNNKYQPEYPITSISDLHGNTITYTYDTPYNTYRIQTISYNGASILFKYINRDDITSNFCGGIKMQKQSLLSEIVCKIGTTVLGTYKLTYVKPGIVSLLSQIDYSAQGQEYNPIRLYYGEGNTSSSYNKTVTQLLEWYQSESNNSIRIIRGKFDYNIGDDGIISYPNGNPYWFVHRHLSTGTPIFSINKFENKYSGSEKILLYTGLSDATASPMPNLLTEKGFVDIICADLYGTQEENIIKINDVVSGDKDRVTFHIYGKGGLGTYVKLFSRSFEFPTVYTDDDGNKSIQPKFYYTGDFNGDGKIEVMAMSAHQPFAIDDNYENGDYPSVCYIFDLANNKILYQGEILQYRVDFLGTWQTNPLAAANNTDKLFVIDCDGDGKSELFHINETKTSIYRFGQSADGISRRDFTSYSGLKRADLTDRELLLGDFNGDGLADLIISPLVDKGANWIVYNSTGNGQFEKSTISSSIRNNNAEFIVQDVNNDGVSDLIRCYNTGLYTYLFSNSAGKISSGSDNYSKDSTLIPIDINSHSQSTQILALNEGTVTKYSFSRDDHKESLLTGVVNSLGVIEKNDYKYINSEGITAGTYTPSAGANFPYVNIREAIPVIASTKLYLNGNLIDKNTYTYNNAVYHKQGLGFRGFSEFSSINMRNQVTTQSYDPFNFCLLKSEVSPSCNNTYSYSTSVENNKVTRINMTGCTKKDILKGVTKTLSITYDQYGFPTEVTTSYPNEITVTKTSEYVHSSDVEDGYNLGFEKSRTTETSKGGTSYTEFINIISYSKSKPLIISKYKNNTLIEKENFSYDSCGNILQHSIRPFSSTNETFSKYEYDKFGRIVKESNHLGISKYYTYDSNGNISTTKDKWGNTTTYTYDAFRRISSETYPDNTSKKTSYSWSSEGTNGLYAITKERTGKPTVTEIYDALNRIVREKDTRFDGSVRKIDKIYDTYGNMHKKSLPFAGDDASYWDIYSYDAFNRLTSISEASGRKTTLSYNGLRETTVENKISTTITKDALGNIVSVSNPAGTVTYTLAADGQPVSVTAPGNVVTTFTYDTARRRTELNDPSKGVTKYEYDASGNLSRETDANEKTVSYTYDQYGRLTGKSCPEFTATYTYNEYDELAKVSSDNGTSTEYTYDSYGRTASIRDKSPGDVSLLRKFTYESGNVSRISYAANLGKTVMEKRSYANGHLIGVTLNDSIPVFKLSGENAMGQPTKVVTGPLTRTYSYSAYGLPTGRKAVNGSTVIQDFSYTFDHTTHNLTSRTDNTRARKETFAYDNLNRLTSFGGKTATYDSKGNILSKSDIGTYSYSIVSKPYALTGVPKPDTRISANTQEVTYTSFSRPASISENNIATTFTYNAGYDRVRTETIAVSNPTNPYYNYYLAGCYEATTAWVVDDSNPIVPNSLTPGLIASPRLERFYIGGDCYDAPAAYVRKGKNNSGSVYYILRDYLGSITHIVTSTGKVKQELSYDAWGSLRDPDTHAAFAPDKMPQPYLWRGYTGHEHLYRYGLVNMNARLYDPTVGRFLSPDPLVQMPDMTQNFNRYSYCLNNPLKYSDPNGEFIWTVLSAITDIFGNILSHGFNFSNYNWNKTTNAWKIDSGMFRGNFMQILGKWTWGLVNSIAGNVVAQSLNFAGKVDNVTYLDGMAALSGVTAGKDTSKAFTIGHYSMGPDNYVADWRDNLFVHEYGHYIQSQIMGPLYIHIVGIPSLLSAGGLTDNTHKHRERWFEVNASSLGAHHFDKRYGSGKDGYSKNSPNFFHIDLFRNGNDTPYKNPRKGNNHQDYFPTQNPDNKPKFIFWDFFL